MGKVRHAEEFVYQLVVRGDLEIDSEGRIWRVACRRGSRWGHPARSIPCIRRRAEKHPGDYLAVSATIDGKQMLALAHRLVWRHFNGPIPGDLTVNHQNGIKDDNRPSNLELATDSEQIMHAVHVLKRGKAANQHGVRNSMAKLTDEEVREIRDLRTAGLTQREIGQRFGISHQSVSKIVRGDRRSTAGGEVSRIDGRSLVSMQRNAMNGRFTSPHIEARV